MRDRHAHADDEAPISADIVDDLDLDHDVEPNVDATAVGEAADDAAANESLATLLGGGRAAIEASVPPAAFVAGWLIAGHDILWGSVAAVMVSLVVAMIGFARKRKPRAVVIGLLGVVVAAMIAYYTGEARNFFLIQLLSNAASALAWMVSIVLRWPFLGLIVGALIGTKVRWRKDPALLRAYSRASWVWVMQYVIRVTVFGLLWMTDQVVLLGIMRIALSYPLIIACLVVSGWVLFRSIPRGHPGIRRPQSARR